MVNCWSCWRLPRRMDTGKRNSLCVLAYVLNICCRNCLSLCTWLGNTHRCYGGNRSWCNQWCTDQRR
uniref:Uncharacterized protein n=1 Tax=Brassica campestris TaxID=3711 RepID=A0A3P5YJH7_BRACM|nr:unnamed protein product [Brassica rapa]